MAIRQELFNLKNIIKQSKYTVLYNWKQKKCEVFKTSDIEKLKKQNLIKDSDELILEDDINEPVVNGVQNHDEESKHEKKVGY